MEEAGLSISRKSARYTAGSMLNVRELRSLASRLTEAFFCNQIGPFVLVQKPPRPVVEQMAMRMGAQSTMVATGPSLEAHAAWR